MLNPNFNAFNKIGDLVSASLQKLSNISKPRFKFFSTVFELWLALPVRYTMLNLGRLGAYSEKSIRLHFENLFDFVSFNVALIKKSCTKELIAAFDPSCIPRSGRVILEIIFMKIIKGNLAVQLIVILTAKGI